MDALALRLQHARHRVLREPVDLAGPGRARAARARSRRRGGRGRGRSARRRRARAAAAVGATDRGVPVEGGVDELADREVDREGCRPCGDVVAALDRDQLSARRLGQRLGVGVAVTLSSVPLITSTGHWTRQASASWSRRVTGAAASARTVRVSVSGSVSSPTRRRRRSPWSNGPRRSTWPRTTRRNHGSRGESARR